MEELFNVEINHPMYSIHYVAKDVPLDRAIKIAKSIKNIRNV